VNAVDDRGDASVHCAAAATLPSLLMHRNIDVNQIGANGMSMLMTFVHNCDDRECFTLLLRNPDVNVNIQNKNGETALMLALRYRWDAWYLALELAADERVDITLTDNGGHTALSIAVELNAPQPVVQLLQCT
jgi:ankyrin repeat protein